MIARAAFALLLLASTARADDTLPDAPAPAPTPAPDAPTPTPAPDAPTPALTPAPDALTPTLAPTPTPGAPIPARLTIAPNPLPPCPPRFSLSLGAGVGVPIGASADRVDAGLHAAVDFRWFPDPHLAFWAQATLSLLPLVDGLPLEPGGGSSLTAFTVVAGVELRTALTPDLELVAALGLGAGGFGIASSDEALGWAIDLALGARYFLDDNLALRLDFAPVAIIPSDAAQPIGGHLAVVLRGEARF